jgi:hypothetical protein
VAFTMEPAGNPQSPIASGPFPFGWALTPVILAHGGTAAFMLMVVELLRRQK